MLRAFCVCERDQEHCQRPTRRSNLLLTWQMNLKQLNHVSAILDGIVCRQRVFPEFVNLSMGERRCSQAKGSELRQVLVLSSWRKRRVRHSSDSIQGRLP